MIGKEEAVASAKWASVLSHIKANRIEYLLLLGILHIVGATTRIYSEVEGVCL